MTIPYTHPKDANLGEKRPRVKLYYVGVKHLSANGRSPSVLVKGQEIKLPDIGRSMTVDAVLAKDIIFQSSQVDPELGLVKTMLTEAEGGAEIAKALLKAQADGLNIRDVDISRIKARALAVQLSDADLVEELKNRGVNAPQELLSRIKEQKGLDESPVINDDPPVSEQQGVTDGDETERTTGLRRKKKDD